MYRNTKNKSEDLKSIVDIYNDITNRKRTEKLHSWEWFESPYENKSYVIIDREKVILGHHGILTVKLNYEDKVYTAGKTENTIMKKGFGPLYFKNEMAMHKEYIKDYDILITTTAKGVTKKIREKLGYKVFGNYISFIRFIDINFLSTRVKNILLKKIIKFISPLVNIFFRKSKVNQKYKDINSLIDYKDLEEIETFYDKVKNRYKYSQIRSIEFLEYRVLNNPYSDYFILKLYNNSLICGYLIYNISDKKVSIEDVFFEDLEIFNELLNRLYNHIKINKLAYTLTLISLENSMLDIKIKGFFKRVRKEEGHDRLMLKNNIKDMNKDNLKIENFYFTKLMMEGIR